MHLFTTRWFVDKRLNKKINNRFSKPVEHMWRGRFPCRAYICPLCIVHILYPSSLVHLCRCRDVRPNAVAFCGSIPQCTLAERRWWHKDERKRKDNTIWTIRPAHRRVCVCVWVCVNSGSLDNSALLHPFGVRTQSTDYFPRPTCYSGHRQQLELNSNNGQFKKNTTRIEGVRIRSYYWRWVIQI